MKYQTYLFTSLSFLYIEFPLFNIKKKLALSLLTFILFFYSTIIVSAQTNKEILNTRALEELKNGSKTSQKISFDSTNTLFILDNKLIKLENAYKILNNLNDSFSVFVFTPSELKIGYESDNKMNIKWILLISINRK